MTRPTDICIVLCALPGAHEDGWVDARQIAKRLGRLGFDCNAVKIGAALMRMSRMDAPPIEVAKPWDTNAYRVTPFGETWLRNLLPDIWHASASSEARSWQRAVEASQ